MDLAQEETRVHKDLLVLQVQLDPQDPQDKQVILDQEVTTVLVGPLEVLDRPDQEEAQEDKEQLGQLVLKGLMVTQEHQEVKVQQVKQDHVVILVHKANKANMKIICYLHLRLFSHELARLLTIKNTIHQHLKQKK